MAWDKRKLETEARADEPREHWRGLDVCVCEESNVYMGRNKEACGWLDTVWLNIGSICGPLVQYMAGNFLINWGSVIFSGTTLLSVIHELTAVT